MQTYSTVCKLLGAFLEPTSLWTQLRCGDQPIARLLLLTQGLASFEGFSRRIWV